MADAVSNFAPTAIPSFLISSPEDALNVMDAVQVSVTDTIRDSIRQNVSATSRLLAALDNTSKTCAALYGGLASNVMPVTVASLESTPKTAIDLQTLFLKDGPMMGTNLQEADDTFAYLTSLGLTVDAPVITPVLVTVDNMDGAAPIKTFAWYSQAQLTDVQKLAETTATPYPGASTYVKTLTDGSGKVTQTISFTTFDSYANRRTTTATSFTYIVLLINLAVAIQLQLIEELVKAAKQADKLDDIVKDNRNTIKDEDTVMNQRRNARDEQLAEALRQLRVLKAEREELRARARSKVGDQGKTDSETGKNEAYGLEHGFHAGNSEAYGLEHGLQIGQSVADVVRAIRMDRSLQPSAITRNDLEREN